MKLTVKQLANILQVPVYTARRWANYLHYTECRQGKRLQYYFTKEHPLVISMQMINDNAKPLYTIAQIAQIWDWRGGKYSTDRVSQKLNELDVQVYNKSRKGFVYLCDLRKLLED